VTANSASPDPSYPIEGPARRQPAGPGTRLFEAELGARSVQIIPICVIGAGSDEIGEAVQNGGYRVSHDRGAVTAGNEAPVWPSPTPRTATTTSSVTSRSDRAITLVWGW
jgi:hypothetical protein